MRRARTRAQADSIPAAARPTPVHTTAAGVLYFADLSEPLLNPVQSSASRSIDFPHSYLFILPAASSGNENVLFSGGTIFVTVTFGSCLRLKGLMGLVRVQRRVSDHLLISYGVFERKVFVWTAFLLSLLGEVSMFIY